MRVLIADDQADVRSALMILLEHMNDDFNFEEAEDAAGLFEKAVTFRPDLILLDWELSGSSMWDEVSNLRKLARGTAIIALSSRPEAARTARAAGVDAFVSKGENSDALLAAIQKVKRETGQPAR
ncbi:MAG TPA: response regulator transcription factor [Clostridia bacterium]|nr:response regulator transcription factor [Clostridia bacterium]